VTVFPIQANGQLGAATAHVATSGVSPHGAFNCAGCQQPFRVVCDLGLDQIRSYVFNPAAGNPRHKHYFGYFR